MTVAAAAVTALPSQAMPRSSPTQDSVMAAWGIAFQMSSATHSACCMLIEATRAHCKELVKGTRKTVAAVLL